MNTNNLDFDLQHNMWISDMLAIFDLIRTNKHAEFSKDEISEFVMQKNALTARFTTSNNEVAEEFSEYLNGLDFKSWVLKSTVIVDFKYNERGRYIDNDLYKKIVNFIKDELNVYPY